MSIGTNIYNLRKEKKLTQAQLAEKLGVSEQAVSKWENEVSLPDVSLFPAIASLFKVSIDRLFDYHQASHSEAVSQILKDSETGGDMLRSIEVLESGLQRYPNSPELKTQLAHLLFMLYLNHQVDTCEREQAIQRAISLCREVADNCTDETKADHALNILRQIYCELGDYRAALNAIDKLSPDNYRAKLLGKAQVLAYKRDDEFDEFTELRLLTLYIDMNMYFTLMHNVLMGRGEYEKSIEWSLAREKLTSVFDDGCPGFFMSHKTWNIFGMAQAYMKLGDKEKCLEQLKRIPPLLALMNPELKDEDYHVSKRNTMYFSHLTDPDLIEEYLTAFPFEFMLKSYDGFFDDDEDYLKFKQEALN
ncbi:MAG: helix-turn-helix transcriptional regulator [Oscillospiraceae bacterium]|nr:helix-turn-helix transcriptional regulator [Oscillospiraceae bacterium]